MSDIMTSIFQKTPVGASIARPPKLKDFRFVPREMRAGRCPAPTDYFSAD